MTLPLALVWVAVAGLVAVERLGPARAPTSPQGGPPLPPSRRALGLLALAALACAAGRLGLASARVVHSTDEAHYAALAAFLRSSGEGPLSAGGSLRAHSLLYLLAGDDPFARVDAVTSLAVGLTGFVLGLTLLRATGRLAPALLAPPAYALGLLSHEGLTSNAEPYANLFLSGWLLLRTARPAGALAPPWARVVAGACLGLAVLMKEQALVLAAAEPALLAVESAGRTRRQVARDALAAGLGLAVPLTLLALALLAQGVLGAHVRLLLAWGLASGSPLGTAPVAAPTPGSVADVLAGLAPACATAVGLLGVAEALARVLTGDARGGRMLAATALVALAALGLVAAAIGQRFFAHYFMLADLALAPLAALRLGRLRNDLARGRRGRVATVLLLALAALNAQHEARRLLRDPHASQGYGLTLAERDDLEAVAARVRAAVPPGRPILVWGWRPELYHAAARPPASRFVSGAVPDLDLVLRDLAARPPALVVVPGRRGLLFTDGDPFALPLHPRLLAYLQERGLSVTLRLRGYTLVAAPGVL